VTLWLSPDPACPLADTAAFVQVGQPSTGAPWAACTSILAHELVPFPAH
jgi:hypothetical protein